MKTTPTNEDDSEFLRFFSEESAFYAEEYDGQVTDQFSTAQELFIHALFRIERLVDLIAKDERLRFELKQKQALSPKLHGKLPAEICQMVNCLFKQYSDQYSYSPKVTLFFEACFAVGLQNESLIAPLCRTQDGSYHYEKINALIDHIQQGLRSPAFKRKQKTASETIQRRIASATAYVDYLFRENGGSARLIVLRVDFYYKRQYRHETTIDTVRQDMQRFLANRRNNQSLFQHLKGYLWKLEYGEQKGFHIHWLLFMDGRAVQNDFVWASRFGLYWQTRITQGRGYYNNGNARKDQFWHLGVGRIERNDDDKLSALKRFVIPYLAKTDQYLRAKQLGDKVKVFDRGQIEKPDD